MDEKKRVVKNSRKRVPKSKRALSPEEIETRYQEHLKRIGGK